MVIYMRRTKFNGNFFMCLLINMMINLEGAIPAVVLLILHFVFDISIWWFVGALGAWIVYLLIWMSIFRWAHTSSTEPQKVIENKNPYSVGAKKKDNTGQK